MIRAMLAMPRLPAVMAMVWPGFTFWPRFRRDSSAATVAAISLAGSVGDWKAWRTRKMSGYCDMDMYRDLLGGEVLLFLILIVLLNLVGNVLQKISVVVGKKRHEMGGLCTARLGFFPQRLCFFPHATIFLLLNSQVSTFDDGAGWMTR